MIRSLVSQFSSLLTALLLAVVVWSVATNEDNPTRRGVFESIPIEVVNPPAGLVVFQKSPETVRAEVRAPQSNWDQLRASSFRATLDLKSLEPGVHQVPVSVQSIDARATITAVEPDKVTVRLEPFKARIFDIHAQVLDSPPLGYIAKPPTLNPLQASVSGPASLVDQVTEVSAEIFLRGSKSPIEREVTLIARDVQGNLVQGVSISPVTVAVGLQIEQRVGYKDAAVSVKLSGAPAPGYWISNIVVAPSTVTLVGNADVLSRLPGYIETQPVDVSGATADLTRRSGLALPDNVTALNFDGASIQISVTPILGGQPVRRNVTVQGLRRALTASPSPDSVDVILSGPLPTLQNLSPTDVPVIVDATGLGAGTYQLKPRVPQVPESVRVQSIVPDTIQVTILEPTPTVSPTWTVTTTSALAVTATIPITIPITPTRQR